jgi:hypothetical protein
MRGHIKKQSCQNSLPETNGEGSQPRRMTKRPLFRNFKASSKIIGLAVMLYIRFPLSLRNVKDILHERGIEISQKTGRPRFLRWGPNTKPGF